MTERKYRRELHHERVVRCHADRPADVYAMFVAAVMRAPSAIAVIDGDVRWSYRDLAARISRCARRLTGLGLTAGDRLGLLLDNRADYLTLLLASAKLGIITVPMNIRQRAPETAFALENSGAVALVYDAGLEAGLPERASVPQVRHWLQYEAEADLWAGGPEDEVDPSDRSAVPEDHPFCLLYTSGTTGRPKGAVITHLGIVTSCLGSRDHLALEDGESMILSVPASHVTGILLVLMLTICVAGKVSIQRGFKAGEFLALASRERMTFAIMVPAMYNLCLLNPDFATFDLSSWRIGAYGGAPMAESTIENLARELPQLTLVNIYGSTETTSPAVIMPLGEGPRRKDKVGRALPYADILVVDDNGRECPPGAQGEIWIGGAMVVPGYWNNPDATASGFVHGYWKSGDLGTMDEEGYIRILDRMKDMINRGGFKIYSAEVENVLMAHDAIVEAVVVGRPCEVLGERVEAFAVASRQVEEQALRSFCAQRLSDYKVPERIRLVPGPLPRNPNGKLLKTVVRDWLKPSATERDG